MITNTYRQNIVHHLRIILSSPSAPPSHLFSTFELYFFTPNRPPHVDGLRQAWPHSRRLCVFSPAGAAAGRETRRVQCLCLLPSARPLRLCFRPCCRPPTRFCRAPAFPDWQPRKVSAARLTVCIQLLQTDASSIFRACPSYPFSRSQLISLTISLSSLSSLAPDRSPPFLLTPHATTPASRKAPKPLMRSLTSYHIQQI